MQAERGTGLKGNRLSVSGSQTMKKPKNSTHYTSLQCVVWNF